MSTLSITATNRVRSLESYANDPVGFVRDVLPEAGLPYGKQVEMLESVARNRRVSVVGCNGSGKDWGASRTVIWWVETRPRAKAIVTGPTQRQVEEVVWREMRLAYALAGRELSGTMHSSRYVVNDERFALGFATDYPYNLQGFHSPELLVVVTEAHAVGQQHLEALQRLNPKRLLLTGNPLTATGEFYDSHHAKSRLYARVAISAFDTPNLIEGRPDAMPGMLTPEDVEERRREWGEDHMQYVTSVLGEFPEALDDSLVSRRQVDAAVDRWRRGPDYDPAAIPPAILGVDVARYGQDKTALCLRRGSRVESFATMRSADTMRVAGRVHAMTQAQQIATVFVDETGVGGGVVDRLRELGVPVIGVQVGKRARIPDRYDDLRAEIFWEIRTRMEEDDIAIPDDPELIGQLLGLQYETASSGRIRLKSKEELRRRGLPSPDKADALALAFMRAPSLEVWW